MACHNWATHGNWNTILAASARVDKNSTRMIAIGTIDAVCDSQGQSRPSNFRAVSSEDAGFWPVTSLPSVTTKDAQSAPFS